MGALYKQKFYQIGEIQRSELLCISFTRKGRLINISVDYLQEKKIPTLKDSEFPKTLNVLFLRFWNLLLFHFLVDIFPQSTPFTFCFNHKTLQSVVHVSVTPLCSGA